MPQELTLDRRHFRGAMARMLDAATFGLVASKGYTLRCKYLLKRHYLHSTKHPSG